MKSNLLLALIVILITSCNQRQKPDFDYIDFSIYRDRAQKIYRLKIFQDGKAYINSNQKIYIDSYKENNYVFTLSKNIIDTISLLIKPIETSKLDSVYYTDCLSCMNFNLIIKTKENKYKYFHLGDLGENSKFKILEDYVNYLYRLIGRSMTSVDSSLKFESWTDRLLPPQPPSIKDVIKK
jgi:hypothetical protein